MNEKSYRVLEYGKIIELLGMQAGSAMAKAMILKLKPHTDMRLAKEAQDETTEASSAILRKGMPPMGAFYDIEGLLNLANKGGTLSMGELLHVRYNLGTARSMERFLKSDLEDLPILLGFADVIAVHRALEEEIGRCVISEDELADNASPELRNIRRNIMRQNEALRSKLNQIISSSENRALLQDAIVTMRQGRYVIPVKQEHKTRFPGMVHDQSSSGATLFIEPQAIVNMNNELRELELAEKAEIERILAELSAQVAACYHDLLNNQQLLIQLDFIFAKGKLSVLQKASEPVLNQQGRIRIKKARHPLIDPLKVVPVDISVGGAYHTLIVTGPNTGGKTVTLKTAGLLCMMAQAGLHIPVSSGTEIAIFQKIYADIGDEQSIEQSLSTFSSHMNNIVQIVNQTDPQTLILLDELGAGTDPAEGAALAIAILENLAKKGAKTMATTHYTELKKYAISKTGVENASMEFDVETLSPTYKLTIGIPGKSNAFDISRKLGLPPEIIDSAAALMEQGDVAFEEVISAIAADRKIAEEERDEAILLKLAIEKQREDIERKQAEFDKRRDALMEKARDQAKDMIEEAKIVSAEIQKELKELSRIESLGQRTKCFQETRKKLKEADGRYHTRLKTVENPNPARPEALKIGSRVKVLTLDQEGEVLTLPDEKGDLLVQAGLLKINLNISDLMVLTGGESKKGKGGGSKYTGMFHQKARSVSISFNVQGRNLDDAMMDVDKYLDDAFMAGLSKVTIIHGRGEGILREGLCNMFKSHRHVVRFRKGTYNEGGDGVTVVELK